MYGKDGDPHKVYFMFLGIFLYEDIIISSVQKNKNKKNNNINNKKH